MIYFSHTPKAKATIVADTPEMKRLADNTKIQSNVQYHAEFEANKSKFTAVTDDPESKRLAANTRTISNISYHGLVDIKEEPIFKNLKENLMKQKHYINVKFVAKLFLKRNP